MNYGKLSKQVLCIVLCLALLLPGVVSAQAPTIAEKFADIKGNQYENQLREWIANEYIKGMPDGTFKPNNEITRAEIMALVNRSFDFVDTTNINYSDVSSKDWFYKDAVKAVAKGFMIGSDGKMNPKANMTRQEFAVLLARLAKLEVNTKADAIGKLKDLKSIPDWSKGAANAIMTKGYMKDFISTEFKPTQNVTRLETVVALDNVLKDITKGTYSKKGIYGPEKGIQLVEGNVTISASDVTIQNMKITGDLVLKESIGDGNVYLKNIEVLGNTTVRGGGAHTVIAYDSVLNRLIVAKDGNDIRILASGATIIRDTSLQSGARLEEENLTGTGFGNVIASQNIPAGAAVEFSGDFASVQIQGSMIQVEIENGEILQLNIANTSNQTNVTVSGGTVGNLTVSQSATNATVTVSSGTVTQMNIQAQANVQLQGGTVTTMNVNAANTSVNVGTNARVTNMVLDTQANVTGQGTIETARVNVSGVTIEKKPTNIVAATGVTANVAGTATGTTTPAVTPATPSTAGSSGGGGGSSSGGNPTVYVSGITVIGAGNATSVVNGETLQMSASVIPTNATDKTVKWAVTNGTGEALIDASTGLLQAKKVGTVTVIATSAASEVTGVVLITVTPVIAAFGNEFEIGTYKELLTGEINDISLNNNIGDGAITLKAVDGKYPTDGEYISQIIDVPNFEYMVASWNSDTPEGTYVEIQAKVLVNHFDENSQPIQTWTEWLSWGKWSPFIARASADTNGILAETSTDELIVKGSDGETASKVQMKVILHTDNPLVTPTVRYLHGTLKNTMNPISKKYKETIDVTNLNKNIITPAYSQMIRCPRIKNSICSLTTITMIMNRFGERLLPEEVAQNTYDNNYGFGNWAFAMASTGSYGYKSYVDYTTVEGLKREIAKGYPVGVSVKYSNVTTNTKYPYVEGSPGVTGGHLIVVTGFETINGVEYVLVNDSYAPENETVSRKYKLDQFEKAWSNRVAYIVHDKELNAGSAHTMRIEAKLLDTDVPNEYKVYANDENINVQNFGGTIAYTVDDDLTYKYFPKITNKNSLTFTSEDIANPKLKVYVITDMGKVYVAKFSIPAMVEVSTITVTPTTMNLTAGGATGTITATVLPVGATNKTVTWLSSNEAVATVAGGVVTPKSAGIATITVTTVDGNKTATCGVTVEAVLGATTELTKITDTVVKSVRSDTADTKEGVEAAMLIIANAEVDSNYTVTIAEGSTYVVATNEWVGKFVVTHKIDTANTKTDASNRNIIVVIRIGRYAVDNDVNKLGLIGTSVTSSEPEIATAQIVGDSEKSSIRIDFLAPGTATITVKDASNHEATINVTVEKEKGTIGKITPYAPTITMTDVPESVMTETKVLEDISTGQITGFEVGSRTPIGVTLTKGSLDYSNVRVIVTGLNDGFQLIAQDTSYNWYNIVKTGWGPEAGFALADATTNVYLVANVAGTYTATIKLVDVLNSNAVLATTTTDSIIAAPAPDKAALETATSVMNTKVYTDFTAASWATFEAAKTAIGVMLEATQAEVNAKTLAINTAVAALVANDKVAATVSEVNLAVTQTYGLALNFTINEAINFGERANVKISYFTKVGGTLTPIANTIAGSALVKDKTWDGYLWSGTEAAPVKYSQGTAGVTSFLNVIPTNTTLYTLVKNGFAADESMNYTAITDWTVPATYVVKIEVTDNDGNVSSVQTVEVTVAAPADTETTEEQSIESSTLLLEESTNEDENLQNDLPAVITDEQPADETTSELPIITE